MPWAFTAGSLLAVPLFWQIATGHLGLFLTPILIFAVLPLLDHLVGTDTRNPSDENAPRGFAGPIVLAVLTQTALTATAAYVAGTRPLTPGALADLVLSTGILSGALGINTAHELIHRRHPGARLAGFGLLTLVGYGHWGVEHVHGHHRWVATPHDPATARRGESLFAFLPRVLVGELVSGWKIEAARLARAGKSPWGPYNRVLCALVTQLALLAGAVAAWGPRAGLLLVGAAAVAVFELQVINYVEHYGLVRRQLAHDAWERVDARHSWNAAHRISNLVLLNLARHADHHAYAARPYHQLHHLPDSPQMPTGYAGMLLLALVPPAWFRVMDRRLPDPLA